MKVLLLFWFLWKSPSKSPQICTVVISSLNSAAETSFLTLDTCFIIAKTCLIYTSIHKSDTFRLFNCFYLISVSWMLDPVIMKKTLKRPNWYKYVLIFLISLFISASEPAIATCIIKALCFMLTDTYLNQRSLYKTSNFMYPHVPLFHKAQKLLRCFVMKSCFYKSLMAAGGRF